MRRGVTVEIEGLKELDAALSGFTDTKRRSIGRKALDEAGQITARAMRSLAPRDEGHLVESIDVSGTLSRRQRSLHKKVDEQERFIGPGADPAAVQQEFGNERHGPRPFARPGWDGTKQQVLGRIVDELWIGVSRETLRLAKKAGAI